MRSSTLSLTNSGAAIWSAPFRPFYLLGIPYAIIMMCLNLGAFTTLTPWPEMMMPAGLLHGHELIFGFAGAIITGFALTALPSWAGTEEIIGKRLMLLSLTWCLGRLAVLFSGYLPLPWVMAIDSAYFLLLAILVMPGLCAIPNKIYLASIGIFLGLALSNLLFYQALMVGDYELASNWLKFALYFVAFKFTIVGGFMTPIFTNNTLKKKGYPEVRFNLLLEGAAIISLFFFFASEFFNLDRDIRFASALLAFVVHGFRMIRWRGWLAGGDTIALGMQAAYLLFVVVFLLRAYTDYQGIIDLSWLHGFTVGAMSLMMLSLMTRVVLRHTGRQLRVRTLLFVCSGVMVVAAAVMRVMVSLHLLDFNFIVISGVFWVIPFIIFLLLYGSMLITPSLSEAKG